MKKLLNLLSSFAVIASSISTVVACNNSKKEENKDLKNLTDSFTVTSFKTAKDFKEKLIAKIKKESGFDNLTDTEIEIFKKDGTVLNDTDIIGTIIEVKIKIKNEAKKITGEKDIKVNWSEATVAKNDLSNLTIPINAVPLGSNIDEFKDALIIAIVNVNNSTVFTTLTRSDFSLYAAVGGLMGTAKLLDHYAVTKAAKATGKIEVTIVTAGSKYGGKKTFEINLQADLASLTTPIGVVSTGNNIDEFKEALIKAIKIANTDNFFAKIDSFDFELKNPVGDMELTHDAVITAKKTEKKIKITVVALGSKYEGKKTFEINLQADLRHLNLPFDIIISAGNNIDEFKEALVTKIRLVNIKTVFVGIDKLDFELNNANGDVALTHDEVTTAAKTTGKIDVTVKELKADSKYIGSKKIQIGLQADLKYLKPPTVTVSKGDNIDQFLKNLCEAIKIANVDNVFADIFAYQLELKNAYGDVVLTHDEVTTAAKTTGKIEVTIKAKISGSNYVAKFLGERHLEIALS